MAALTGGQLKCSRWWKPHSMQLPLLSQDDFFLQPRPDRLPHLSSCPPTRDGPAVPRAAPRRSSGTKTAHCAPTRRYPLSFHPCVSSLGFRTDCGRIIDLKWTNIWPVSRQKLLLLLLGSSSPCLVYYSTRWWTEDAFVVDARHTVVEKSIWTRHVFDVLPLRNHSQVSKCDIFWSSQPQPHMHWNRSAQVKTECFCKMVVFPCQEETEQKKNFTCKFLYLKLRPNLQAVQSVWQQSEGHSGSFLHSSRHTFSTLVFSSLGSRIDRKLRLWVFSPLMSERLH